MWQTSYDNSATLYLVPTPIGNLEDMTFRAINVLKSVDVVFSEDTRVTSLLLNHYEIKKHLISLHDHNEDTVKDKVLKYLKSDKSVAIVTDRGTPIISDPGYKTVKYVTDNGYNVVALPGANAFVPALISSGIEPSPFLFYGFLNAKDSKQKKELMGLKDFKFSLIFYESPHRLKNTLINMLEVFGDRNITISREISKLYEEITRDKISNVIELVDSMRGEFVLVVEGNKNIVDYSSMSILEHIKIYLDDGISEKDAIKIVAKERGIAKSIIYKEYHYIK